MSGFAGVFHMDGAPVDRAWLETMADFLAFRGPDATQVWVSGEAGLCHTLLRTSVKSGACPQIISIDGVAWLTGDARIDDCETLIAQLPGGAGDLRTATSAELILHAYNAWGDACVEHLLGDFSFVIWDARHRRIFAARDHLGVKPLFYAQVGQYLFVSNTLDCIRQISIVSDELNEQAIGDHLIAGMNLDPATTFFAGIRRLPVAHVLIAGPDGLRTKRYWTLPIDEPLYYGRPGDYVDRFQELLRAAVRDRLPNGLFGIFMSGGLDSPAVAAAAVQIGGSPIAFTSVYDRLIPDEERYYAGLVAHHLGIPIFYHVRDDEPWGWDKDSAPIHTPEPSGDPLGLVASRKYARELSAHARVFVFGDGPDAALRYEWRSHLTYLIRQRRLGRLFRDVAFHFAAHRRVPFLATLPRSWRERNGRNPDRYESSFPSWLDPEFEARLGLKQRWEATQQEGSSPHPVRRAAYASFARDFPLGTNGGDGDCPGGPAADFLHPWWDLRLVRFLLAVPVIPWCRNKYLIRTALRGMIPEPVRQRPKAPLAGFPYLVRARRSEQPELPSLPRLARYVDTKKVPKWPGQNRQEFDDGLRVLDLHYWLLAL